MLALCRLALALLIPATALAGESGVAAYDPDQPLPPGAAGKSVGIEGGKRDISPGRTRDISDSLAVQLTARSVSLEAPKTVLEETEKELAFELKSDALFDFDKATIRKEAERPLAELAEALKKFRPDTIRLDGHTDSKGEDDYNVDLSRRRADAVKNWLTGKGKIGSGSFEVAGHGEKVPRAPNTKPDGSDWPEGRALNRRVEIHARKS